ncbi:hypothetical protein QQ054_18895 [Oscillatoria amoena NRMC-F 0135]|nr:hypothetical protein [Oscillatoria amoena NRMC-F 0135]
MYFFSQIKLEKALARGEISQWGKALYLIIPMTIGSLTPFTSYFSKWGPEETPFIGIITLVCILLSAIFTYFGLKQCFKANQLADGKSFIERFTILVFPIMVKLIIAAIAFYAIILLSTGDNRVFGTTILILFGPTITWLMFFLCERSFLRFGVELENVSQEVKQSSSPE